MQRLYCGMTDYSVIDRFDPYITIYGDSSNNTILQSLITNIRSNVVDIKLIQIENIKTIQEKAFQNLQVSEFELILPDTLEYIGDYAFMNCTAVNTIIIPKSVTHLGVGVFYGCASLDFIYFRDGIKITSIPEQFCYSCSALNCVGTVDEFNNVSSTTTTSFPDTITMIEKSAFESCSSLGNRIIIGDNITSIGDYAFYGSIFNDIELGSGLATGASQQADDYQDAGYTTERTITLPYTLYLSSKRQFRYKHVEIKENHNAGYIYKLNDDFKFCIKNSHLMVFKNHLLLPPTYYYLHSIVSTPVSDVGVVFNVALEKGDVIDIFYVTNDLHHLEVDYYDAEKRERYIKNGMVLLNSHRNEYRVMGERTYNDKTWRTNYIKMRSPLYAVSSKHSTFVFLNGKKVRMDELEDISDTIMAINTDYARDGEDMNATRLEVINHLDTQDIIEQLFINDGLSHDSSVVDGQFTSTNAPNVYKNTLTIKNFSLTDLEAYAERTLLDEILNDLSDENLNKLFYNYNTAEGPMTPYSETAMNEPDFINPDEIIEQIIDEYYFEEDGDKFIWHTSHDQNDGFSNTVFYIGNNDSVRIPSTWDDEEVKALYGTTFNRNKTLKKVIIPEGVTSIE